MVMPEAVGERDNFGLESTDFENVAAEAEQETTEEDEASAVEEHLMQQLLMNEDTTLSTPRKKESKKWFRGFDRAEEDERDRHSGLHF